MKCALLFVAPFENKLIYVNDIIAVRVYFLLWRKYVCLTKEATHNNLFLHLSRFYLLINLIISSVVCYTTFLLFVSTCNFKFCVFQEIALLSQFEHENIAFWNRQTTLLLSFLNRAWLCYSFVHYRPVFQSQWEVTLGSTNSIKIRCSSYISHEPL